MEQLELNELTRSDRKWAWTNRNLARADDIRSALFWIEKLNRSFDWIMAVMEDTKI